MRHTVPVCSFPVSDRALTDTLREYWSQRARTYAHGQVSGERAEPSREAWRDVYRQLLGEVGFAGTHPLRILDVGCGSGYATTLVAELGHRVVGVDSSAGMLAEARKRHGESDALHWQEGIAEVPPTVPGGWDVVTCRYVLWTLPDPVGVLRTWARGLAVGGRIAVIDAPWFPHGAWDVAANPVPGFAEAYSIETQRRLPLLAAAGPDDFTAVFREAGMGDVTAIPLRGVAEVDRRCGAAPGHEPTLQYLFVVTPGEQRGESVPR